MPSETVRYLYCTYIVCKTNRDLWWNSTIQSRLYKWWQPGRKWVLIWNLSSIHIWRGTLIYLNLYNPNRGSIAIPDESVALIIYTILLAHRLRCCSRLQSDNAGAMLFPKWFSNKSKKREISSNIMLSCILNGWSQLEALDRSQTGLFAPGCQMTMQEVHGFLNDSERTRFNHVNQQPRHPKQNLPQFTPLWRKFYIIPEVESISWISMFLGDLRQMLKTISTITGLNLLNKTSHWTLRTLWSAIGGGA